MFCCSLFPGQKTGGFRCPVEPNLPSPPSLYASESLVRSSPVSPALQRVLPPPRLAGGDPVSPALNPAHAFCLKLGLLVPEPPFCQLTSAPHVWVLNYRMRACAVCAVRAQACALCAVLFPCVLGVAPRAQLMVER